MLASGTVTRDRVVVRRNETRLGPTPKSMVARMALRAGVSSSSSVLEAAGSDVAAAAVGAGVASPSPVAGAGSLPPPQATTRAMATKE